MIGEKSTTKRFMHSRCGLVRKPITEPLYTSKIQHDPQFTIGIRGNKMCFMLKSTFIQLPLSQETHLVLSSILQHRGIMMKSISGCCLKFCPQLFIQSILNGRLSLWITLSGSFHIGVLSINAKLPLRCSHYHSQS